MANKTMLETLENVCCSNELSDVTFIFNEGDVTTLPAHRIILAMRSEVFKVMFYGSFKDRESTVKIEDIESDNFRQFLRYIYTDQIDLTIQNLPAFLYAAKKYCLDGLFDLCSQFMDSYMSIDIICELFEQAKFYDMAELIEKCTTYMVKNASDVMKTEGFCHLSHESVCNLLSSELLGTTEIENFNALLAWSKAKCVDEDKDDSPAATRQAMGDALYHVRLPLVPIQVFTEVIVDTGILTLEETVELYKQMTIKLCGSETNVGRFSSALREGAQYCVELPPLPGHQRPHQYGSNIISLHIDTSLKIRLRAVVLSEAIPFTTVTCGVGNNRTVDITASVFTTDDGKKLVFNPSLSLHPRQVEQFGFTLTVKNIVSIKFDRDSLYTNKTAAFSCYGATGSIETASIIMAVWLVK